MHPPSSSSSSSPSPAPVEVDGSFGEGGGQILRTAVCFSMVLGVPIHVTKIRAGRRIPGLRPQHSATLKILSQVCSAEVSGGGVGSTELTFAPGSLTKKRMSFDLGTAASIPLVLQAVIPAVSLMRSSFDMELVGGTDVPWSPTSDYLESVVGPAMKAIGISFSFHVERRGYYPNGGGRARVHIDPCEHVNALRLTEPVGLQEGPAVVSRCSKLPVKVAERQANAAVAVLRGRGVETAKKDVFLEDSISPGSSILVSLVGEGRFVGADSIGAPGKPAESVGREAAQTFLGAFAGGATVDSHLADMLAPVLCLSDSSSTLLIPEVTQHLETSLHVAKQFTSSDYEFSRVADATMMSISPPGAK
jgi:RNA 3'-phosphate cyclase